MPKLWIFHSSDELYGSDRVLLQIIEALDLQNWEVTVILPNDLPYRSGLSQKLNELNIQVQNRPLAVLRKRYQNLPGLIKLGKTVLISVASLAFEMRKQRVDLVYTNTGVVLSGAFAARLSGIPHIWGLKEYLPPGKIKLLLARLYYIFSKRITVTSQAVQKDLSSAYIKCEGKISLIFNSVDTERFRPDLTTRLHYRDALGLTENNLICAMLGRITESKGPEVFISAAKLLHHQFPNALFLIVGGAIPGSEHYVAEIKTLVETEGLNKVVILMDFVTDSAPLIKALDVVVMPSLRPEGFGLTLVEAMSTECAVVASAQGGPLETVEPDRTGLLYFPPEDAQALANCLEKLLGNNIFRQELGRNGRTRVLKYFSRSVEAANYRKLFEETLKTAKYS